MTDRQTDRQTGRRYDLDILRIVLTILVVIGHASYYTIKTKYGGIYYDQMMRDNMIEDTVVHQFATLLTDWIYVFHMPAYFCLSGVIFSMEKKKNRYPSIQTLVLIKARRLLLPMLFVWVAWNIPIKMVSGYYSGLKHPIIQSLLQIIFPNAVYLWFLEALFFCFIMDYILEKYVKKFELRLLIVGLCALIGLFFYKYMRQIVPFGNPFKWLIWFWLGHYIDSIRKNLNETLQKHLKMSINMIFVIETIGFLLLYMISFRVLKIQWILTNTLLSFVGVVWIWELSEVINRLYHNKEELNNKLVRFSGNTYGIYLWAEPLNYLMLSMTLDIFSISVFGKELGAVVIYFVRIVVSVMFSVFITKILKNIKFPIKAY